MIIGNCNQDNADKWVSPAADIPKDKYNKGPKQQSDDAKEATKDMNNVIKLFLVLFD